MLTDKILLVDDDHKNLSVVIEYLKDETDDILYAPNGVVAYEIAIIEKPDIIIMDWAMPLMNGIETTLKLKATKETSDIPVIIASGMMTETKDLKQALEIGAIDYLRKPFDAIELTSRVTSAIRFNKTYLEVKEKHQEIESLFEQQKAYHDRELTLRFMYENQKNELLIDLKKRIKKLEKNAPKELGSELNKIKKEISYNITSPDSRDNFTIHFEKVHPNFIKSLKMNYEELTPNDLRIASYIKMGMDNKEIARLTGVKVESVKININRLKKRLYLNPEKSIRDFITTV